MWVVLKTDRINTVSCDEPVEIQHTTSTRYLCSAGERVLYAKFRNLINLTPEDPPSVVLLERRAGWFPLHFCSRMRPFGCYDVLYHVKICANLL